MWLSIFQLPPALPPPLPRGIAHSLAFNSLYSTLRAEKKPFYFRVYIFHLRASALGQLSVFVSRPGGFNLTSALIPPPPVSRKLKVPRSHRLLLSFFFSSYHSIFLSPLELIGDSLDLKTRQDRCQPLSPFRTVCHSFGHLMSSWIIIIIFCFSNERNTFTRLLVRTIFTIEKNLRSF